MNHGPFGLSPSVFGVGFVVVGLAGTILFSWLMSRSATNKRTVAATVPNNLAPQQPGAQPSGYLIGVWHFKSAARWIGVIVGAVIGFGAISIPFSLVALPSAAFDSGGISGAVVAAVASGAIGLFLIVYSLWRPTRVAQQCNVDRNLFITLSRGAREIPLDFRHYRYVRMHVSQTRYGRTFPSMMVFDRDAPPSIGTLLSSMLFPRFDEGRIVLFHNRWTTAQGALIDYNRLDDFFIDTCRRAGYEPHFRRTWLRRSRPPWDAGAGRLR